MSIDGCRASYEVHLLRHGLLTHGSAAQVRSAGFSYVRLDGKTSAKKRQDIIRAFSSSAPGAFN